MKHWCVTIQMKAIEQYFHVVPFILLYKVVLTFNSVDKILACDHSNERYWAVLSCDTVYYKMFLTFTVKSVDETLVCDHSNESY